ncbi:thioredoxin-dependent thiol peroxidase [Mariniphaga sediminis]|jgi:peroxiredoxin Q/BCP|uniref:thioredoxin-dependent peroxiredoxin n=1 Tax=Mariniphaga sediminis TaxID=1628158 RepID=A0A399D104_9BACT|nr:thioredoxin-dependent thiol peroxidase [Mariniphaga sediminis]RIH64351.1 thioredoxin-dependent thiol peroxidase [Mariniphaga sediminis]
MTKLKVGSKAPDFSGVNQEGEKVGLSDFSGKKLVLYFYPKDNTPGCTAESCNLNENYDVWLEKGFEVLGVSPDSVKSHQKFRDKYGLKFDLIADTDKNIAQAYGVWAEKSMFGKKYMGILRTTFVVDENGIIREIFDKVKTKDHTDQIFKKMNL